MSEEQVITMEPKKRGRPAGSKSKTSPAPRKVRVTPKMQNPKKTDKFAIGVSAQHYWLISALAESRSVPRMDVLEGIINKFIATLGEQTK